MPEIHHTIIGLPSSGKTTFLAALWHLLTAGELNSQLEIETLKGGDSSYLDRIVETWRRCRRVSRTSLAEENTVLIYLRQPNRSGSFALSVNDLSGEAFRQSFATRTCSQGFVDGLNGSGGILLFVNANSPHQGVSILDAGHELVGDTTGPTEVTEWTHDDVSEQAKLVDLLRCMGQAPFSGKLRKIAVIISAWDVVDAAIVTPEIWLKEEMPFLWQFLIANPGSFESSVYGVSAQGGDIGEDDDNSDVRDLLLQKIPSERIIVQKGSTTSSDLSQPILWLME